MSTFVAEHRLTAAEARAIAAKKNAVNPDTVRAVVDAWLAHIRRRAEDGKTEINTERLPFLRMPVSLAEHKTAVAELVSLGYRVNDVTVSWGEPK